MKSTKSALLMSFTSLLLCVAMLIGSTFAWFTDSVTSGVNKIQAGNLDIEVSYKDASGNWVSIKDVGTLFDPNALWEPGHTEFVTLKIENKGTLALKYQMNVSPISESGGINMAGNSFKLSDYLVFKTTDAATTAPTYANRQAARAAAVGTEMKLNQAGLSKSSTLLAKSASDTDYPAEYITLVVYMPEDVGNVANYKTGTAAPFINLGITVLATQLSSESDSFNNEYDAATSNDTSVVYNYFPQVVATATLTKGEGGTITSTDDDENVVVAGDNSKVTLKSAEKLSDNITPVAQVEIPAEAIDNNDKFTFEAKKVETATENTITVGVGQEAATYDVSLSKNGTKITTSEAGIIYKSTFHIGEGKTNATFYHGTTPMNENTGEAAEDTYSYDESTGMLTIWVSHYSEFTAVYDEPVAAIGTTAYYSLALAVADAQSGATVTLLKDCKGDGIVINKNLTVDLNGKTYTVDGQLVGSAGTATNGFQLLKGNVVTIKNGKIAVGSNVKTGTVNAGTADECRLLLQNFANLTLNNVTLDGTALKESRTNRVPYVLSNNCGTVDIIGNTSITAPANGYAFDAYYWPNGGYPEGVTVNVNTTGTITGNIELAGDDGEAKNTVNITNGNFVGSFTVTKGNLSITGGTFSTEPRAYVAPGMKVTDNGDKYIVSECEEHVLGDYEIVDGNKHKGNCTLCGTLVEEEHTFNESGVCACGYMSDAALLVEDPNYTCRIGNKGYVYVLGQGAYDTPESMASAINNATDGDVIKLIADYKANSLWAKNFTNGETVTIDLNGKTIDLPSIELQSGNYNIIDSSENGNGKIKKLSLATTQATYAITVNVYGGNFDKISICQGDGTPKDVNIYGGSVTLLENQGTAGVGFINIHGGHVGYLAIDSDYFTKYTPYTLESGYTLGEEITEPQQKTELGAQSYEKLFPVVNPN